MTPEQPSLSDQLKAISRQALQTTVAINSLVDFCEAQAKEIATLKAQLQQAQTPASGEGPS